VFLALLIVIPLFSKGYDFSFGGSYTGGFQFSIYHFYGLYNQITIPIAFSYYPGASDMFSLGFRNKFGYRIIMYDKDYVTNGTDYDFSGSGSQNETNKITVYKTYVKYDTAPIEQQIYQNLSIDIKVGKSIKFVSYFGCTTKYSFLNIPDGDFFVVGLEKRNYDGYYRYINPGFYSYFSIGPSLELSLELINKPKTYSMDIGIPVDFMIPVTGLNFTSVDFKHDEYLHTDSTSKQYYYSDRSWVDISVGLEFTFNFYTFKSIR
jgi:hypothetical protein